MELDHMDVWQQLACSRSQQSGLECLAIRITGWVPTPCPWWGNEMSLFTFCHRILIGPHFRISKKTISNFKNTTTARVDTVWSEASIHSIAQGSSAKLGERGPSFVGGCVWPRVVSSDEGIVLWLLSWHEIHIFLLQNSSFAKIESVHWYDWSGVLWDSLLVDSQASHTSWYSCSTEWWPKV